MKHSPTHDRHRLPLRYELALTTQLFVDAKKTEYVRLPQQTADKIEYLLKEQEGVFSGDVYHIFAAGDKIQGANCHKTALFLTGKYSEVDLLAYDNDDPKTAGHEYVERNSMLLRDPNIIASVLEEVEVPFRISFFKEKDGKDFAFHSITVIGMSNKDRLIGFEKEGPYPETPFRYINVMSVISKYLMGGYVIGVEG